MAHRQAGAQDLLTSGVVDEWRWAHVDKDQEHLRLLAIFHYVVGGMTALFSLFPIIHVIVGVALILGASQTQAHSGEPPPEFIGWIFAIVGGSIVAIGWALAGCMLAAGRMLAKRRWYLFCLVVGGIECLLAPFGTVLGVFTIIVLMRDSVKATFGAVDGGATGGESQQA